MLASQVIRAFAWARKAPEVTSGVFFQLVRRLFSPPQRQGDVRDPSSQLRDSLVDALLSVATDTLARKYQPP